MERELFRTLAWMSRYVQYMRLIYQVDPPIDWPMLFLSWLDCLHLTPLFTFLNLSPHFPPNKSFLSFINGVTYLSISALFDSKLNEPYWGFLIHQGSHKPDSIVPVLGFCNFPLHFSLWIFLYFHNFCVVVFSPSVMMFLVKRKCEWKIPANTWPESELRIHN